MLEIEGLTIKIDNKILLDEASFNLKRGELTALVGASGIGKTTFLNALIFEQPCQFKKYQFDNKNISKKEDIRDKYIYLDQKDKCFNDINIKNNLILQQIVHHQEPIIHIHQEDQVLLKKYPKQLSGGEINRIELDKIWLGHYDLILCDETFSSFDVEKKEELLKQLGEYVRKENCYCLVVTHQKELLDYFDCVYTLKDKLFIKEKETNRNEDRVVPEKENQPIPKSFYAHFFKSKLLGNKFKWLFIYTVFSLMTCSVLCSLRLMTWAERYYSQSQSMLNKENLIVNRVTLPSNTDVYIPIDIFDMSIPLSEEQLHQLYQLDEIEYMKPRYMFYLQSGYVVANDDNLDPYCSQLINDEGIYISQKMADNYPIEEGQIELEFDVPVAQKIMQLEIDKQMYDYRNPMTQHYHYKVKVKGILKDNYYELSQSIFAYLPANIMEDIIKECQEGYILSENEQPYGYNMFNVKLKDFTHLEQFKQQLFNIDQKIVVSSMYDIIDNISQGKQERVTQLGSKILFITTSIFVLFLLRNRLIKNRKQKIEKKQLLNIGLLKKEIYFNQLFMILMNTIINTVVSIFISLYIMQLLMSQRLLTSTSILPLNYIGILLVALLVNLLGHSLLGE